MIRRMKVRTENEALSLSDVKSSANDLEVASTPSVLSTFQPKFLDLKYMCYVDTTVLSYKILIMAIPVHPS